MGITQKTVTVCTCDVCGNPCDPYENRLRIETDGGDGGDVGPAYIHAIVQFDQPYGCSGGIVCKQCQKVWLARYIDKISENDK